MPRIVAIPNENGLYTDGMNFFTLLTVLDGDSLATIHQVVVASDEEMASVLLGLTKISQEEV